MKNKKRTDINLHLWSVTAEFEAEGNCPTDLRGLAGVAFGALTRGKLKYRKINH